MKKTLGGDRLGTGNKMQVDLHTYDRATFNLDYIFRTTMSAGTLVPFMCELGLAGDTFDIDLNMDGKTLPTVGPMFGSFKVQLDVFVCPVRLYNAQLHNNKLGIGMHMERVKFPVMGITPNLIDATGVTYPKPSDLANSQINPSCLLAYLGLRGIGLRNAIGNGERQFNAMPLLGYWDIYKNYYANKQEEIGMVIHTDAFDFDTNVATVGIEGMVISQSGNPVVDTGTLINGATITITKTAPGEQGIDQIYLDASNPAEFVQLSTIGDVIFEDDTTILVRIKNVTGARQVIHWRYINVTEAAALTKEIDIETFPLENIDNMREALLQQLPATPYEIDATTAEPYGLMFEGADGAARSMQASQEGLALKTYQSDLFNNWLSTEWLDGAGGINEITAIDTSSGEFKIDALILAKKVYNVLMRIAVSGGSYNDWQEAVYGYSRYSGTVSPVYMGGLIKELVFQEVVSNAEAGGAEGQPLGTLAGKGVMSKKHKGGNVRVKLEEASYIIGLVSLTPRIDYSQGNRWDVHLKTMDDLHKPELDAIGFQEAITEKFAWWDTWADGAGNWVTKSAGKQPAWIDYMTNYNRCFGNFAIASKEMFMTLNRRYQEEAVGQNYTIGDLTSYIDPRKYNYMFAQTSLDSQNFWVQIAVDMTARRVMSAKLMPNL